MKRSLALVVGIVLFAVGLRSQESGAKPLTWSGKDLLAAAPLLRGKAWSLGGRGEAVLSAPSTFRPAVRSPQGLLIAAPEIEGDFRFEVDIRQTGREYAHRDAVVVFGYASPTRYAYAHLATRADANAHQLMLVDDADRAPFTARRSPGVDWGRGVFRRVIVERRGDRVRVWFDGATTPVLEGELRGFRRGRVGFGSFDDTAEFRVQALRATATGKVARTDAKPESSAKPSRDALPAGTRRLSEDGGWCWFEAPRATMFGGRLVVGSVASGWLDRERRGDIELLVHEPESRQTKVVELADQLQLDDHDQPALLPTRDGALLAVFSKHGNDAVVHARRSFPGDPTRWEPTRRFVPSLRSRVTYSNLLRPDPDGPIYDFFRGLDGSWKPSWITSEDEGRTWRRGGIAIDVPGTVKHRPYARYATAGDGRIHVIYGEGHPRNFDNSLYHVVIRDGRIENAAGELLAPLERGLPRPELGTKIFEGGPDAVAWVNDVVADPHGNLRVLFTTQRDGRGLPPGQGGRDHRFHLARLLAGEWSQAEIAPAGSRLYAGEDDYTGLGVLDPTHPGRLVISSDGPVRTESGPAEVTTHELFVGEMSPGGWVFRRLTHTAVEGKGTSQTRNLRPLLVADPEARRTWLVWLRGRYHTYQRYEQEVLAAPLPR